MDVEITLAKKWRVDIVYGQSWAQSQLAPRKNVKINTKMPSLMENEKMSANM